MVGWNSDGSPRRSRSRPRYWISARIQRRHTTRRSTLASFWPMIVIALAVRRLPYALRACDAALRQISVSLEEAAENLGATKIRTVRRVLIPLMTGGILAGSVTSFATAAVELSATMMLVQTSSTHRSHMASTSSCNRRQAADPEQLSASSRSCSWPYVPTSRTRCSTSIARKVWRDSELRARATFKESVRCKEWAQPEETPSGSRA